jgi:membrane dipeptidase
MQLQYSARDANQEPEERLGGGPTQEGGLTELGEKVVQELIRLGIVVDLAHCNTQTTIDTANIARQHNTPITANHIGARNVKTKDDRWLARYARNATDEKMLAVKNTGGVVGVMGYGPYLRGPYQELRMQPPEENIAHATIDDFVTHVEYVVNLIGIDHVGLCTDGYLDGTMAHNRTADGVLDSPRRWKEVIIRLHRKGYSEEDLQKIMGLNFLRVYRQILARPNGSDL